MEGARNRATSRRRRWVNPGSASLVGLVLLSIAWSPLQGQQAATTDWVEVVFPERSHNFGTVAKGSILRHRFVVANRTNKEIHISGYKPKCGCTDVTLGAQTIPPGSQTTIEAVFDTTKFRGYKGSGMTLFLDQPTSRSIDYDLSCFIQDEVEVDPGVIDFGEVKRGTTPEKAVTLRYSGSERDWRILDSRHGNSSLFAELSEVSRSKEGVVEYRLLARLDPKLLRNGNFRDEVTLVTNDPQRRTIPVSVAAKVTSEVALSPSVLNLGSVKPGQRVERTVLLRASSPFQVIGSKAVEGSISLADEPSDTSRPVHQVKVAVEAPPEASGSYHAILEIETDHPNEPPVRLTTFATVVP